MGNVIMLRYFGISLLELRQTNQYTFDVLFKVPGLGDKMRLGVYARLAAGSTNVSEPHGIFANQAFIERWKVKGVG